MTTGMTAQELRDRMSGSKIHALYIRFFRGIEKLKLSDWDGEQRGVFFLIGPNGSGKSTVLEAIRWLVGETDFDNTMLHIAPGENSSTAIAVEGKCYSKRDKAAQAFFERCNHQWEEAEEENKPEQESQNRSPHVAMVAFLMQKVGTNETTYTSLRRVYIPKGPINIYKGAIWENYEIKDEVDLQSSDEEEFDRIIRVLSLSPSSPEDAYQEFHRKIQEQFLSLFLKRSEREQELSIQYDDDEKKRLVEILRKMKNNSKNFLDSFEAAIQDVTTGLGTHYYNADIVLEDTVPNLTDVISQKLRYEDVLSEVVGNMGVFIKETDEQRRVHSKTPRSTGRLSKTVGVETFSAGIQHSLALLNLYGWLQALMHNEDPKNIPLLLVLIEEPEVYLHPQWARVFSNTLSSIGDKNLPVQAMIPTHSPIFARIDRHRQILNFCLDDEDQNQFRVNMDTRQGDNQRQKENDKKERELGARLDLIAEFHPTVNELFFAKRVVLVEGSTEMWVIPTLARKLWNYAWKSEENDSLEAPIYNTTLVPCGGPGRMLKICKTLDQFGINTIVLHDWDPPTEVREGQKGRNEDIKDELDKLSGQHCLRRFDPDLEGVLGFKAGSNKPFRALAFLLWLFHGKDKGKDKNGEGVLPFERLAALAYDWPVDLKSYIQPKSPEPSQEQANAELGKNLSYLLDVVCEIYTPPGDEKLSSEWEKRKEEFKRYLKDDRKISEDGKVNCPDKIHFE